jgi:DnaJ-class molecular chaperone
MARFAKRPCAYCGGRGRVASMGIMPNWRTCPACDGYRFVFVPGSYVKCIECGGTGRTSGGAGFRALVRCKKCRGAGWSEPALARR